MAHCIGKQTSTSFNPPVEEDTPCRIIHDRSYGNVPSPKCQTCGACNPPGAQFWQKCGNRISEWLS